MAVFCLGSCLARKHSRCCSLIRILHICLGISLCVLFLLRRKFSYFPLLWRPLLVGSVVLRPLLTVQIALFGMSVVLRPLLVVLRPQTPRPMSPILCSNLSLSLSLFFLWLCLVQNQLVACFTQIEQD